MNTSSESPQVIQYTHPGVVTSFDQHNIVHQSKGTKIQGSFYHPTQQPRNVYVGQPTLNKYGQSQIEETFFPIASQHPKKISQVKEPTPVKNSFESNFEQKRSKDVIISQERPEKQNINRKKTGEKDNQSENRFTEYLKYDRSYKYNIFSLIDEPFNRWRTGQKCDNLAGNQCIARNRQRTSSQMI